MNELEKICRDDLGWDTARIARSRKIDIRTAAEAFLSDRNSSSQAAAAAAVAEHSAGAKPSVPAAAAAAVPAAAAAAVPAAAAPLRPPPGHGIHLLTPRNSPRDSDSAAPRDHSPPSPSGQPTGDYLHVIGGLNSLLVLGEQLQQQLGKYEQPLPTGDSLYREASALLLQHARTRATGVLSGMLALEKDLLVHSKQAAQFLQELQHHHPESEQGSAELKQRLRARSHEVLEAVEKVRLARRSLSQAAQCNSPSEGLSPY